jgi:hypothetical protein
MKKLLIILLVLFVFSYPVKANEIESYPYFPMDAKINYLVFNITGHWDEATFAFSIDTQTQRPNTISITPEPIKCPAFTGTKMVWENYLGTKTSLMDGKTVSSNGKYYIGEGINENSNLIYPYEALLSYSPIAGESIEEHSRVFTGCSDNTIIVPDFHWKYKTIAHYATWGDFSDVWRTGLHEYTSMHVYNYVFANGIGMVDFWHGSVDANGNVTGFRFYADLP